MTRAAAAVVEEELIVRLVFSCLPPRLRRNKLSSLDRYRCRLALGGSSGATVCEADEGGGGKEKNLLGEEEEEEESPGGKTDMRENRTTNGKTLLTSRKLEPSKGFFFFSLSMANGPDLSDKSPLPSRYRFPAGCSRGREPAHFVVSVSLSIQRAKKIFF